VPGFEAPVRLAYSGRNRSAAIRIPTISASPKTKRVEVRFPDSSCNAYLAFAAMLMAGLDGIERKIDPGEALDKDIYGLSPQELAGVPQTPGSLEEALAELEKDHAFLQKGDVFTDDVLEMWMSYKRENEVTPLRTYPNAMEFSLYYDI
jgi:glutamine synthetase